MAIDTEHPTVGLVTGWLEKRRLARKHKNVKFQQFADEAMQFYNGDHTFMWDREYMTGKRGFVQLDEDNEEAVAPTFRFTMNKVSEVVQLFVPHVIHRNPMRLATPRPMVEIPPELMEPDPSQLAQMPPEQAMLVYQQAQMQMMQMQQATNREKAMRQMRGDIMATLLNYTAHELDLKSQSRMVAEETFIKGMGIWWTEVYTRPGGTTKLIGSFYDSVDTLLTDPDVEVRADARWIMRECTHPIWEVEEEYGWEPGSLRKALKGTADSMVAESANAQGESAGDPDNKDKRRKGESNDLVTYYKVYSKMGMGDKLSGIDKELRGMFDEFGDNVFLAIVPGLKCPLNLPDSVWATAPEPPDPALPPEVDPMTGEPVPSEYDQWKQQLFAAVQWPIPFWADGEWPYTEYVLHEVPNCSWPMSHISPALGELRWLNWAMSFLAGKVKSSCKTVIGMLKAANETLKTQYMTGGDNVVLEIEDALGGNINNVVSFLQQPPFHQDIYTVIAAVMDSFEKRTGLTELAYGQSTSAYRSATEADVKQGQFSIRPDDMVDKMEDAQSRLARKEALAWRWLGTAEDVMPALGPIGAQLWAEHIQSADLEAVTREVDYRIEAGSTRKPNKATRVDQMNAAVQYMTPIFQPYAQMTGNVQPLNALINQWCKAQDVDPAPFMLQPMPPPMLPAPSPGGEGEGQEGPPQGAPA